jgi:anti-sigma B factor antagonist
MSEAYYQWSQVDGLAVVEITTTEIKHPQEAQELGIQLRALLAAGEKRILLNLAQVQYLSSTGFATLMGFAKDVKAAGGELRIAEMHPDVRIGAGIIRLGDIIPIHEDEASALAAFHPL